MSLLFCQCPPFSPPPTPPTPTPILQSKAYQLMPGDAAYGLLDWAIDGHPSVPGDLKYDNECKVTAIPLLHAASTNSLWYYNLKPLYLTPYFDPHAPETLGAQRVCLLAPSLPLAHPSAPPVRRFSGCALPTHSLRSQTCCPEGTRPSIRGSHPTRCGR